MDNRTIYLTDILCKTSLANQPRNIWVEFSFIQKAIETHDWRQLSDEEKQDHRKGSISLGRKWAMEDPGTIIDERNYHYLYVEVYDHIIDLLRKLEGLSQKNIANDRRILRLECLLRMAKDEINELWDPQTHLPDYLFIEIRKELREDLDAFGLSALDGFVDLYSEMYQKWPQKPNIDYSK
jgi:hypothetical protein